MKHLQKLVLPVFITMFVPVLVKAGSRVIDQYRLSEFSLRMKQRYVLNREQTLLLAAEKGWPVRRVTSDGAVLELQGMEYGRPVYYITHNAMAAQTASTDKVWPSGCLGYSLTGNGQTAGIWDGGAVRLDHVELTGRVIQKDGEVNVADHATHMAGTIIASGVNSEARGMAYEALLHAYTNTNDITEMTAAATGGLTLSNHSYGPMAGWTDNLFGDGLWAWFGDTSISETEEYLFGFYIERARDWDEFACLAPQYLLVVSSGNDCGEGPVSGAEHWVFNGSEWVLSTVARDRDGYYGYDCINGFAVAKNVLTVGAIKSLDFGYLGPEDVYIVYSSSTGPTDDGRIKPDLVADGNGILSSSAEAVDSYLLLNGTSSATASVTGSLLLIQEYYQSLYGSLSFRSSTQKALLIHTALEAGSDPGPDYVYGWGVINTAGAIATITEDYAFGGSELIQEIVLHEGESLDLTVMSSGEEEMKATICWTDPPGPVLEPSLNPDTTILINDVDLRISGPGGSFLPWVLDPEARDKKALKGDNSTDNVEQVLIEDPTAGTYTVQISHKGTLTDGPQVVSLILSGIIDSSFEPPATPQLTGPENNSYVDTSEVTLQWQEQSNAVSYIVEVSQDSLFDNVCHSQADLITTSYVYPEVPAISSFYWRVRAWNAGGWSPYSEVRHFQTSENALPIVWEKISPAEIDWYVEDLAVNSRGHIFTILNDTSGINRFYCSRDRGLTWEYINSGAGSLIFDSQYNLYGWAYSDFYRYGKDGLGTDYSDTPEGHNISDLFFDANDHLYASMFDGTVYKSTDFGESWNPFCQITTDWPNKSKHMRIIQGDIYMATWGDGILRSEDGGENWETITEGSDIEWVYTLCGTEDGGLLAGTISGLYKSDINTINWEKKYNGAIEYAKIIEIQPGPCGLVYASTYGCSGNGYGVFLSQDYGDSWITINTGFRHNSPKALEIAPSGELYVGIGTGTFSEGGAIYRGDPEQAMILGQRTWGFSAPGSTIDLVSPAAGTDGLAVDVRLYWNTNPDACQYRTQISEHSDFSSLIYDAQIPDTSLSPIDLDGQTTYYWRVCAVNVAGCGPWSEEWSFTTQQVSQVISSESELPATYALYHNAPNPFNATTKIIFELPEPAFVTLTVFDILGRQVEVLVSEFMDAGSHSIHWQGKGLATGVYFYRLKAGDFCCTRKLLLQK